MGYGDWPKKFVGQTISKIETAEDGAYIQFTFQDPEKSPTLEAQMRAALRLTTDEQVGSTVAFNAYGDCCSTSWIESFDGADTLIGEVVLVAEEVSIAALPRTPNDEYDVVQDYCWRFTTRTGFADLIFRNDSNGYYGGSLEETEGPRVEWKVLAQ